MENLLGSCLVVVFQGNFFQLELGSFRLSTGKRYEPKEKHLLQKNSLMAVHKGPHLSWFPVCITALHYWLKKVATLFISITSKTKTNDNSLCVFVEHTL